VLGTELVRASQRRHRVSVDVAHELPPAEHLPDGTLRGVERHRVVLVVGLLHCLDDLHRVEQADVDTRPQKRVGHRPIVCSHRVLVRAKLGQTLVDELAELPDGLSPGHRPRERPEVGATPGVELVGDPVCGPCGQLVSVVVGQGWRLPVLGRKLLVLVVVVPLAADRVAAVHQDARLAAHPPVKGLVAEAVAPGPVCPLVEGLPGAEKQLVSDNPDVASGGLDQLGEPLGRPVTGRAHGHESGVRIPREELLEGLAEGFGFDVDHVVARLAQPVTELPHGREQQRQLVVVVRFAPGEPVGLDQQHAAPLGCPGKRACLGAELCPKHPRNVVCVEVVLRWCANRRLSHTTGTCWGCIDARSLPSRPPRATAFARGEQQPVWSKSASQSG